MALALDDQRLVQAHQAGDTEVFAEIFARYRGPLLARARSRLGDAYAAEDAVQETFLRAYRALPRFNGEYRLGGWLRRILENVCADEGNRRGRERVLTDRWAGLRPTDSDQGEPAAVVDELAARRRIGSAWHRLSHDHREVLVLRFVKGFTYAEVADAAGVSEETVRARVSRARAALRGMLGATSAVVAFVFAFVRRTERAVALGVERGAGSGAAQAAVEASSSLGAAKAGVVIAAIGVAAASLTVPAGLVDRSGHQSPPRLVAGVAPDLAPGATSTAPTPTSAAPAPADVAPAGSTASDPTAKPGVVSAVEPVTSPGPTVAPVVAVPTPVSPVRAPVALLPEGQNGLTVALGDLDVDAYHGRIGIEGTSTVSAGEVTLTGDVDIRLRVPDGDPTAAQGRLQGQMALPDGGGTVELNGSLVAVEDSGGSTTYQFAGQIHLAGGAVVPFSAVVVLANAPSGSGSTASVTPVVTASAPAPVAPTPPSAVTVSAPSVLVGEATTSQAAPPWEGRAGRPAGGDA